MENEAKKDVDVRPKAKPEPAPEELALRKFREKDDLRTFFIAFMAAVVVVAGYHISRQIVRIFVRNSRPPMVKRYAKPSGPRHDGGFRRFPRQGFGGPCPCCCRMPAPGRGEAFGPRHKGPRPGRKIGSGKVAGVKPEAPKPGRKIGSGKVVGVKPEAPKPEAPKPEAPKPAAPEKK